MPWFCIQNNFKIKKLYCWSPTWVLYTWKWWCRLIFSSIDGEANSDVKKNWTLLKFSPCISSKLHLFLCFHQSIIFKDWELGSSAQELRKEKQKEYYELTTFKFCCGQRSPFIIKTCIISLMLDMIVPHLMLFECCSIWLLPPSPPWFMVQNVGIF